MVSKCIALQSGYNVNYTLTTLCFRENTHVHLHLGSFLLHFQKRISYANQLLLTCIIFSRKIYRREAQVR